MTFARFLACLAFIDSSLVIQGGTNIQGSVTGTGDSSYLFGTLLKGGPALSPEQFPNYDPTTTLGVSVTITAPTGLHDAQ